MKAYRFDALLFFCNHVVSTFPSRRLRNLFYRKVMKIEMSGGANIMSGAWLDARGHLSIAKNSVVNQKCRLDNRGTITIGENVSISPEVHIITADHDIQDPEFQGRHGAVIIENRVFIGSRATILPGVKIGEGAVVAACSCVTKDVEPYSIVAGIPARKINLRTKDLTYEIKYKRHFI